MQYNWQEHFNKVSILFHLKNVNCICELAIGIELLLKSISGENNTELYLLIDTYLDNFQYKDEIHYIREKYNSYKHSNGINSLDQEIDELYKFEARYIIPTNKMLAFISEQYDYNIHYQIVLYAYDEVEQNIEDGINLENSLSYNSGYLPFNRVFLIKNIYRDSIIFKKSIFNSIVCVIHNILSIGSVISKSKYIESLKLSNFLLEKTYIFEILFLNILQIESSGNNIELRVNSKNVLAAEYAINDIKYYYKLINELLLNKTDSEISAHIVGDNSVLDEQVKLKDNCYTFNITNETFADINGNSSFSNYMFNDQRLEYQLSETNFSNLEEIVSLVFGYSSIREGQKKSLFDILNHNDGCKYVSLSIMPTGYGKSMIYQLISIIQPVMNIVISPSDILIEDQLVNARDSYIFAFDRIKNYQRRPKCLLYYSTPLEIQNDVMRNIIFKSNINDKIGYIFFDEVHQLSIWGQRFDPDFLSLANYIVRTANNVRLACFTATATRRTIIDLKNKFQWHEINILEPCSMIRGNLKHNFIEKETIEEIFDDLINHLYDDLSSDGLIMVINNNISILKDLYDAISNHISIKIETLLFENYSSFDFESFGRGIKRIILATDNFTIGINVKKLKKIYTIGIPASKEWYYQETGRVCRDEDLCQSTVYYLNNLTSNEKSFFNPQVPLIFFNASQLQNSLMLSNLYPVLEDISLNDLLSEKVYEISKLFDVGRIINRLNYDIGLAATTLTVNIRDVKVYNMALYVLSLIGYVASWYYSVSENDMITFHISFRAYYTYQEFMKNNSLNAKSMLMIDECFRVQDDPLKLESIFLNWFNENIYLSKRLLVNTALDMCKRGNDEEQYANALEEDLMKYFMLGLNDSLIENKTRSINKLKTTSNASDKYETKRLSSVFDELHFIKKESDLVDFKNKCQRLYEFEMNSDSIIGLLIAELSKYNNYYYLDTNKTDMLKWNDLKEVFKDIKENTKMYSINNVMSFLSTLDFNQEMFDDLYQYEIDDINSVLLISYLNCIGDE